MKEQEITVDFVEFEDRFDLWEAHHGVLE